MKRRHVEVAIIGSGTAGMGAYRAAKKQSDSIVMIEAADYGTTCARVGCMPSKLLIAAAESAHHARHTDAFGVKVEKVIIDGKKVMERVRRERDRFVGFVLDSVEMIDSGDRITGYARFVDDHTLSIIEKESGEELLLIADRIVIATGSRPVYPKQFNEAGDRLLTNDDIFELDDLPDSIAIFGPGVIGLELGQALSRLGVNVKVFGRGGAIAGLRDAEIQFMALNIFNEEFYLDPDAHVKDIARVDEGVEVVYIKKNGEQESENFQYILAATGRRPNIDNLGLENTSVNIDDQGVPLFDRYTLQTQSKNIFIAGDASNDIPLLHEAADEGRIAGDNAGRFPDIRSGLRRVKLGIVFTDPQMANVGMSLQEVKERCVSCYAIGEINFEGQGRSRVMLKNKGLLKVYGEHGSGLFLGAEMFGPAAEHVGHLLAWAVQQKMTVGEILDMPFYHPVIEEGVRTAFRDLNSKLNLGPEMIEHCLDCGPGA